MGPTTVKDLGPPVRVNAFIRGTRWSFLAVGVLYGVFHQNRLTKKENKIREIEAKEAIIRNARLAEEKKISLEAESKMLDELIGVVKKE